MKAKNIVAVILFIVILVSATNIIKNRQAEIANKSKFVYNTERITDAPVAIVESTSVSTASTSETSVSTAPAVVDPIVYDGMTMNELTAKLDKSLTSTLTGTGTIFAHKAVELGIDPYLSIAIVLHETGCAWTCSSLVSSCNNVGGMKSGSTEKCGSSYSAFPTLEAGIDAYMDNLAQNYINKGLTTAALMQKSYTGFSNNNAWTTAVNNYIAKIKSR